MKKLWLLTLIIIAAFAIVSCGEKAETITDEGESGTQLARAEDIQVTQCDGNVCTHETASSRECAVEGVCPHQEQAAMAQAGVGGCPYAEECRKAGKCMGKCGASKGEACTCGGTSAGSCQHGTVQHVCTEDCPKDCPHAHVCSEKCGADCPHAAKTTKVDGCGGCPLKKTCKAGS